MRHITSTTVAEVPDTCLGLALDVNYSHGDLYKLQI